MKEIEDALAAIGLSKNEIKTYIALVKFGQSSALENSKNTGIHRSNSYDSLKSLVEKGFVSQVVDGSRMVFIAREPEVLKDYQKQQEKELELAVKELNELSSHLDAKEGVLISTGLFSVKEIFNTCIFCESPVEVYGITKKVVDQLGEGYFKELKKNSIKNKVYFKVIGNFYDEKLFESVQKQDFCEVKHLPEKFDGEVVTSICGGKVILFVFSELPLVIEIKNQTVYNSYKKYFEILWRRARS
ncbi:hypothetical protein H8D91_00100 [archaeon]|nr:hypothetical protein [archaeon]